MTAPGVFDMKRQGKKVVCLTAYDVVSGTIAERAGVDLVLVGDSVGNVVLGYETTIPVEMDDILSATKAVARAVDRALLIADLPFGSYQESDELAVRNSVACMKAGAAGVKLEGAYIDRVKAIKMAGIPVMGHVGFTPQSVHAFGGFKVQGRTDGEAVLKAAKSLDEAGVFAIVLELIPADLAQRITEAVSCPTIGIGAGVNCDGQIQVFHDVMGLGDKEHKHARRYVEGLSLFMGAAERYAAEVRASSFPDSEHSF